MVHYSLYFSKFYFKNSIFKHGSKDCNPKFNLQKIKYFQVFKRHMDVILQWHKGCDLTSLPFLPRCCTEFKRVFKEKEIAL